MPGAAWAVAVPAVARAAAAWAVVPAVRTAAWAAVTAVGTAGAAVKA